MGCTEFPNADASRKVEKLGAHSCLHASQITSLPVSIPVIIMDLFINTTTQNKIQTEAERMPHGNKVANLNWDLNSDLALHFYTLNDTVGSFP